jgi:hypothetical protein
MDQDREQWRPLVNMVMKLRVKKIPGNVFTSSATIIFTRTLLQQQSINIIHKATKQITVYKLTFIVHTENA